MNLNFLNPEVIEQNNIISVFDYLPINLVQEEISYCIKNKIWSKKIKHFYISPKGWILCLPNNLDIAIYENFNCYKIFGNNNKSPSMKSIDFNDNNFLEKLDYVKKYLLNLEEYKNSKSNLLLGYQLKDGFIITNDQKNKKVIKSKIKSPIEIESFIHETITLNCWNRFRILK